MLKLQQPEKDCEGIVICKKRRELFVNIPILFMSVYNVHCLGPTTASPLVGPTAIGTDLGPATAGPIVGPATIIPAAAIGPAATIPPQAGRGIGKSIFSIFT